MTVCPVAWVVHCEGCPVVNVCPLKTTLGDFGKNPKSAPPPPAGTPAKPADKPPTVR